MILSKPELKKQGVPVSLLDKHTKKATQEMTFLCGGGNVDVNKSIQVSSPLWERKSAICPHRHL